MQDESEKINILMVDDNLTNLLALETILQGPDRNLVRASSGDEALRYLLNMDVAVILLDVYMPGIDGLETAALIRGREKSRDIPIIFLTADSMGNRHIAKGYSLGAVDYILKPVEPDILRSKVAVFVDLFKKTEEIKQQAALLHEKNLELENANLQRLGMLIELGQQLAAERDPVRVLEKFCHAARDIVGAVHAGVGVLNGGGPQLRYFFRSDLNAADGATSGGGGGGGGAVDVTATASPSAAPRADEGILATLLKERRPLRLNESDQSLQSINLPASDDTVRSFLAAPIFSSAKVYGWLYLTNKLGADEFSEADERLAVTLSTQVAVAYENAMLYTEAQRHAAALQQEVVERKQAEEERARMLIREQVARAEAEAANRTKDEFLATLSHELRTPLTSILGWSHLLRTNKLDQENMARALETIERNARSQSQLIDDLLDVSRIITGKLRLDVRPVELVTVIEAAIDSMRPAAEAKAVNFAVTLDRAASQVSGDSNRLQQVVWNLFSNAVKFTPEGGRVEVRLERRDGHAQITVSDTGQGIAPQFLPFIFDRFRQADGSTTRKHGGLGLGLAIVRHLVELHGGTIKVHSDGEGHGATFSIALPLRVGHQSDGGGELSSVVIKESLDTFKCSPVLDGLRILIVDDEEDARELISTVLKQCSAEVRACASAAEALSVLQEWKTDLLISDIGMPEEDGYSLIKKVRQLGDQHGQIPAIALTAYASTEDRIRILSAGFQMHVAKPVEPEELVTVIANVAGRRTEYKH
ncbi:MAG TPA: response regulator [Pyrinomonadaceae bacterium]|jgi:signal transduction histidine kinase/DNA-binding response OmpR family regulator|nr:response regulator [Pyrinomonadaceae bacterium]